MIMKVFYTVYLLDSTVHTNSEKQAKIQLWSKHYIHNIRAA